MGHAPIKQSADVANTTKPTPPTMYKPIGKCIYCGSDGGNKPLSDEHIIPRSFAGGEILPRSSCAECAKVTSYLEGYCGRKLFWELRIADGFPTRRPKERPKALPVSFDLGDRIEKLNLPINDHPSTVAFPLWPPPNILFNDSPTEIFGETIIASWTLRSKVEKPEKTKSIKISISMDGRILARTLAKIAHCHLVAERGLESFVPFLPPIILGQKKYIRHLMGSEPELIEPSAYRGHYLGIRNVNIRGHNLIVIRVRLFPHIGHGEAKYGPPIYLAVA